MIRPTQADIGRHVIYRERGDFPGRKVEIGVLTSFNERSAFVRYGVGTTSAATAFEDLEWPHERSSKILATIAGHPLSDHTCPRCGMTIRADEPIPCWHRDCPEPTAN